MQPPKFTASRFEIRKIVAIAQRAQAMAKNHGNPYRYTDILMDLEACHCNGCQLDLDALLAANQINFAHDIYGIRNAIDRDSGKLKGCFEPRHALGSVAK